MTQVSILDAGADGGRRERHTAILLMCATMVGYPVIDPSAKWLCLRLPSWR